MSSQELLAFPLIEAKFASRICGCSVEAERIVMKNINDSDGDWGVSMELNLARRSELSTGSGLDEMNHDMIQNIAASL